MCSLCLLSLLLSNYLIYPSFKGKGLHLLLWFRWNRASIADSLLVFSEDKWFSFFDFAEPNQEASVAIIVSLGSAVARMQAISYITLVHGEAVSKHGFVHIVNFVSLRQVHTEFISSIVRTSSWAVLFTNHCFEAKHLRVLLTIVLGCDFFRRQSNCIVFIHVCDIPCVGFSCCLLIFPSSISVGPGLSYIIIFVWH